MTGNLWLRRNRQNCVTRQKARPDFVVVSIVSKCLLAFPRLLRPENFWTDITCRSRWPRGLRPLVCWECGFESHLGHGCLSLVNVVCCQTDGLIPCPEEFCQLCVCVCVCVIIWKIPPLHLQCVGIRGQTKIRTLDDRFAPHRYIVQLHSPISLPALYVTCTGNR